MRKMLLLLFKKQKNFSCPLLFLDYCFYCCFLVNSGSYHLYSYPGKISKIWLVKQHLMIHLICLQDECTSNFLYNITSSAKCSTSSFPMLMPFISFSCLAPLGKTSSTMLNRSGIETASLSRSWFWTFYSWVWCLLWIDEIYSFCNCFQDRF